ncbi:MAG: VWA domain-containing protein [Terriglobia bacterium]
MSRISCVVGSLAAFVAASLGLAVYAQQPQTPSASRPTIKAAAEEVLLDVVVRDKKGHRVDNLKPEDFQIFDNGEPKKITSFRLVQGGEAIGTSGTGSTRTQLDPLRQIRLVTMIFRCTDNNSRRLAHDAAVDLLKGELPQNVYMAIMVIDFKLEVLQAFTNDTTLLRQAIDRATRSDVANFATDTELVRTQLEHRLAPNESSGPSPGAIMDQILLAMIRKEERYDNMQVARTTIYALLGVVTEQYRLPGRKTVLYFSGGFVKPKEFDEPFKRIISIANRSNVSFYTVDAHGLMATSTNQGAINMLNRAGQTAQHQAMNPGDQWTTPDEIHVIDTGIESTRANPQTALEELAASTGGAMIANTNDLQSPLHKLAEDIQTYYEISYNPEIKTYDGSFRKITIKLASSDLRVQSRSGYIALPPAVAKGSVLRAFEVPLLTALDSPELPKAFSYEATAMHFRGRQGEPVCELVMDIPLAAVTLEKQGTGQSSGRLSYVALLKDGHGEVVKKFQNERAFNVPAEKLDGFKASHFIYTEHFELPPGPYAVETAVLDGRGNKISARKSSLTMPPAATTLALSSVTFVRNMRDREASSQETDPLVVGTKVISPTLNPVISKVGTEALPFYMVIYPDKNALEAPQLIMEFRRAGQVLGRAPAQLGQPDKDGRIQLVATVPLARLEPGDFTLRFVVNQGTETAEETASFILK